MESANESLGLIEVAVAALLAALPSLIISIWAWFKARAAQSPETWDDRLVELVEEVVRRASEDRSAH